MSLIVFPYFSTARVHKNDDMGIVTLRMTGIRKDCTYATQDRFQASYMSTIARGPADESLK
jgi:hypothetical protein